MTDYEDEKEIDRLAKLVGELTEACARKSAEVERLEAGLTEALERLPPCLCNARFTIRGKCQGDCLVAAMKQVVGATDGKKPAQPAGDKP